MNYYYLDANNQPVGPLPDDEIRRRAAAGAIPADPLVAPEGGRDWQRLSTRAPAGAGFQLDGCLPDAVAVAVRPIRDVLSPALLQRTLAFVGAAGHYVVAAGGILGIVYTIYSAIRGLSVMPVVACLLLLAALAVAQFTARQFLAANESLLARTPVRMSSQAVLECVGLLVLTNAALMVIGVIIACIRYGMWQPLPPVLIAAVFWTAFAAIALHPESLRVDSTPGCPGEELIGLIAFVLQALLRLVPLAFLALAVAGGLIIVLGFFDRADYLAGIANFLVPLPEGVPLAGWGMRGLAVIITACVLPLLAHLAFLVLYVTLDLWRSFLALPGKLDALKR